LSSYPTPVPTRSSYSRTRVAVVTSADGSFRQRINQTLTGLRWQVREATSGAEAWAASEAALPAALIVDTWLPDLDQREFLRDFRMSFPDVELLLADGTPAAEGPRGPHRQELLYALRRSLETDTAIWNATPILEVRAGVNASDKETPRANFLPAPRTKSPGNNTSEAASPATCIRPPSPEPLPDLIGHAPSMLEVSRRIRLVAPRTTPVLIEGPTGSGKELVAEALHRLSPRNRKSFVAINCAAIPETLLEAELFGHTRGAFTGAVQGRIGRIESADGGTLLLDEIGEMPLGLQSKLLRFVESGELQRVGDNETVRVDVRIVAATHRRLAQQIEAGTFRADLYYRLAVFLIRTPSLEEHMEDLPFLVEHFLQKMGRQMPVKQIDESAMASLRSHAWPGNVRELEHVLERAAILAGEEPILTAAEIDFGNPLA
jgi:DNA-binding NtrC family response regulator